MPDVLAAPPVPYASDTLKEADKSVTYAGPAPTGLADTPDAEAAKAAALEGYAHGMTLPRAEDVPTGAPGCQHCEVLPRPLQGPGTLRLTFPHTYTLGKILEFLNQSPWEHQEQDGVLSIRAHSGSLAPLLSPIMERMSSPEQRDTRASYQSDTLMATYEEIGSLPHLAAHVQSGWLLEILRGQRLASVFQPILHCGTDGAAPALLGHECLMRATLNDETIAPGPMLDIARRANLLFQLDLAARRAALVGAAHHSLPGLIFINFSPNSIYDPYTCLDSTVRMADELGLARERLVFEITESERLPEMRLLQRIVGFYREKGFCVALDDFGAGYSSMDVLLQLRPDYVKLDRSLVSGVDTDPAKALAARKLLETAQGLGLKTIAEGIERPEEWEWVRKAGADFVQGYFFARPASPPPPWGNWK